MPEVDMGLNSQEQECEDEKKEDELTKLHEFIVNSGEAGLLSASMEELHEMSYQSMLEEEYRCQYAFPLKEVNLARPHEYCAMVTACLNGWICEQEYIMLVNSRSGLNISMLHQTQEL